MSIEELRAECERWKRELDRLEGQQETAASYLKQLERQARDLGLDPDKLDEEIGQLMADAEEALKEVRSSLVALGEETNVISH